MTYPHEDVLCLPSDNIGKIHFGAIQSAPSFSNSILKEEAQVLVADVNIRIPAEPSVLFLRLATTAEPMAVDLILDLIWGIAHVYARVDVRRAHLCLRTLQRRKELGVQQGRLQIS